MKRANVFSRIALCGLLCALSATASAGDATPEERAVPPCAFSLWAAPGVVLDVAPYGLEKWSPGLFLKASLLVSENLALSVRPFFLYENSAFSLRAAATLDLIPCKGTGDKTASPRGDGESGRTEKRYVDPRPYLGGGLAWYKEESYFANPMISGGLDIVFSGRFVLMTGGNLLLERGDTDLELLGGFGIKIR